MALETLENLKRAVVEYDTEAAASWGHPLTGHSPLSEGCVEDTSP